jgi:DNA-directed RNA polymerase specialized sigma24 family protein
MLISEAVAQDLPRLRRYARALTGSQASGDAYVTATLEALVEDAAPLDVSENVGVALYRVFSKIWNSVDKTAARSVDPTTPIDRHIEKISPLPRQAFLLVALEEFSEEDAATILSLPAMEIPLLVVESARELPAEIATDVLIIEDEPLIAMDLEGLVES